MLYNVINVLAIVITLIGAPMDKQADTYTRCMQVVELNYEQDLVICMDAVGYEWQFYGCEDYMITDIVCCEMLDVNNTDIITDDWIVGATYSGYQAG